MAGISGVLPATETDSAWSLGARDVKNLSRAISWLTFCWNQKRDDAHSKTMRCALAVSESKQCALLSPVHGQPRGVPHQRLRIQLSWLPTVYDGCGDIGS